MLYTGIVFIIMYVQHLLSEVMISGVAWRGVCRVFTICSDYSTVTCEPMPILSNMMKNRTAHRGGIGSLVRASG